MAKQHRAAKRVGKVIFSRFFLFSLFILLQLACFGALVMMLAKQAIFVYWALQILSLLVVVRITSKEENPSYKLAWVTAILVLPVLGGLFYLMWGRSRLSNRTLSRIQQFYRGSPLQTPLQSEALAGLEEQDPHLGIQARYIEGVSGFPVWQNTQTDYYKVGEEFFSALLDQLETAQHFILLEYFIIGEGIFWDAVSERLLEKAAQGVEVRILYDDVGCLQTLPENFRTELEAAGIRVAAFNPFQPHLNMAMNYRDHRKLCVIDGNVGFCGGINLADEYINAYRRFGHWKDTAVMLRGDAVWNLTLMFLSLWEFTTGEGMEFSRYIPTCHPPGQGYVQPFGDSPLDTLNVAESAYMHIISRATRYVYITTPYLILDNEMITALTTAAQSGIDVRILTPYIPDKWYVHTMTRGCYEPLVKAGVKIYEYTPGFIHAKMFVSDDKVAIVGTTNMDYRSFYLHFECGVTFYHSPVVDQVKEDILRTLEISRPITWELLRATPMLVRLGRSILRLFAPLM